VYGEIINRQAMAHNLRPDVVACIVIQESNGDTFAGRFEEEFYEKRLNGLPRERLSGWVPKPGQTPSLFDERLQRASSFGLMQVLGDTARWCGKVTAPYLTKLCDPDVGVDVGCRVLSFYLGKGAGDYRKALKFYNGSWEYADKILTRVKNNEHVKFLQS
jgi:hypothetical protein